MVRYPKGRSGLFLQDYYHRVGTVNVHLAFKSRAVANDLDLLFFWTYFDKLTSGKEKGYRAQSAIVINKNEYLIADALCMIQTPIREELYAIEYFNGDNTHRVHASLFNHLQALSKGEPSNQFGLQHGSYVLCVFELQEYKLHAMKRLCEDKRFSAAKEHFLFKSIQELSLERFFDWWLFDGTSASLF